ncbi:hypothetical protein [Bythopirellula polymerisocia]|uniref:Uncharacterized protein n=1 Tax=Bythopirellula polymerisocia TaxID=2528003 RepID=A0A5C6C1I2_9BACT|nr:hypothetical protein [Bythopirellula polymerisocia]TWU17827.1 hypothetical protein Pla144_50340 [Bythopirellula polymerisocia]
MKALGKAQRALASWAAAQGLIRILFLGRADGEGCWKSIAEAEIRTVYFVLGTVPTGHTASRSDEEIF